jgi:maltose/maltodextrin transport system permease protein
MHWLWNSIKVAGVSAALIVMLSTTSSYAFSRLKFRGKALTLTRSCCSRCYRRCSR